MKKYIKIISVITLCLTLSITTVGAKSYIKDLFQARENIKIEKELDGTSFLAGTKVKIKKSINGIGFIAGENVTIEDKQEYIFAVASKINVDADIKNDIFIFSEKANLNGKVKRDAYVYATDTSLNGEFDRNVYLAGNTVKLKGSFNGNITINATNIEIEEGTKIKGTLKYNDSATIDGLNKQITTKTYTINNNQTISNHIYAILNSYINITLLSLLLVLIAEKMFKKSLEQTTKNGKNNVPALCLKGFVILIGIPIITFMALTINIFTSISIVLGIIYGILLYTSSIFTAYYLAHELDKRYFKKNMNSYTLMIIGLLILKLLTIIPIIGGLISATSLLLGLGISGNMIIEMKTKN